MTFERVHTVWDYYDGPRTGLADFRSSPHYYSCEQDTETGAYGNTFRLSPVDKSTMQLALEQWQIWRDWELAFHTGKVAQESHPGLGGNDERYDELEIALNEMLQAFRLLVQPFYGTFRPLSESDAKPEGMMRDLEVEWRNAA